MSSSLVSFSCRKKRATLQGANVIVLALASPSLYFRTGITNVFPLLAQSPPHLPPIFRPPAPCTPPERPLCPAAAGGAPATAAIWPATAAGDDAASEQWLRSPAVVRPDWAPEQQLRDGSAGTVQSRCVLSICLGGALADFPMPSFPLACLLAVIGCRPQPPNSMTVWFLPLPLTRAARWEISTLRESDPLEVKWSSSS